MAQDPLAGREQITLDDLRQGLADPARRDTLIERHFARAALSATEKEQFLRDALENESLRVRQQAAIELARLGLLDTVVRQTLLELAQSEDKQLQQAAVIALEHVELDPAQVGESYGPLLVETLGADDPLARDAAATQLEAWGPAAVPMLVDALRSGDPAARRQAAVVLSRLIGTRGPAVPEPPAEAPRSAAVPPPKAPTRPRVALARQLETEHPQVVRVYFGTNREIVSVVPDPRRPLLLLPPVFIASIGWLVFQFRRPRRASTAQKRGCFSTLLLLAGVAAAIWSAGAWNSALRQYYSTHTGTTFGPRRDQTGTVHYGFCDVSIPPTHQLGEVEQPVLGPEDESQHVVVRRTRTLEEEAFFRTVREVVARQPAGSRSCFVFVHGFNVPFQKAARRTAQIHHDLKFQGAPLFYSWPSRGGIRHYPSDRNEIGYSHEHIKNFLLHVAERVAADRIHVIAHSMGADGVCRAIAAMGDRGRIFEQIVLAAPDIDADVFRQQVAPRVARAARRTTVYCSQSDWALHLSYTFNDAPRAGDSSRGIILVRDVDTVDASGIDTDLLGHTYYGDCLPLLRDVALLIEGNLAPQDRRLIPHQYEVAELPYWTFPGD